MTSTVTNSRVRMCRYAIIHMDHSDHLVLLDAHRPVLHVGCVADVHPNLVLASIMQYD